MSNYTKTTDFEAKDSLPTGDSGKIIRGAEFETEFDAISTAIATKADTAGPTFTGTLTFETISDGTIGVTAFVDEDDMSSDSATLVPTQQSVKAYVDAVTTELNAQDLDFQADTGGALSIDLDTETMTFTGGTGIDTSGSLNTVTFAIDSTVATLTGTQTLTNKTLTSPDVNTPDIDGGTIDGATIATSDITVGTGKTLDVSGGTLTLADDQISGDKVEGGIIASTTITSLASTTVDTTNVEVTNIKAKDGTSAGSIADTTGVVTLASSVLTTTDINGGTIDGATIGGTTAAAGSFTTVSATGDITVGGTVDGRDVAADGTKLDGIEAGATADQTDAEIRAAVEAATDSNVFTDADHSKLDGIEAGADVTDTANVTAAGALMDSEVTNLAQVKAFDSADYATAAQGSTADSAMQDLVDDTTPQLGGDLASNGNDILFADNDKAIFGAGSDLQIFHSGTHSYISDAGTGDLKLYGINVEIGNNSGVKNFVAQSGGASKVYYNGAEKLATTSTGIDVTGTVTADGLTVDGTGTLSTIGNGTQQIRTYVDSDEVSLLTDGSARLDLWTGGNKTMRLDANGDISFYEDTGTTAKFFWDASAEKLGIGTTSPGAKIYVEGDQYVVTASGVASNGIHVASATAAAEGTYGGAISFDTGSTGASGIAAVNDGPSDTDSNGLAFFTHGSGTGGADAVERVRIDYAGNVGIGTSSPLQALHVNSGTGNSAAIFESTDSTSQIWIKDSASSSTYQTGIACSGDNLLFNNGGERMRIDSSGNLLVGTTDSTIFDHTTGEGVVIGPNAIQISRSSDQMLLLNRMTTNGLVAGFYAAGVGVGSISVTGSATTYNTSSDQRLKDNIVDAPSASDDIDAIQVRSFDWKADGSHQKYGMVAQELQSVAPEAVTGDADSDEMMGVDYSKLVPMLVKEIQSLRARVAQLEGEN